jgi:hypothetical protein
MQRRLQGHRIRQLRTSKNIGTLKNSLRLLKGRHYAEKVTTVSSVLKIINCLYSKLDPRKPNGLAVARNLGKVISQRVSISVNDFHCHAASSSDRRSSSEDKDWSALLRC